MSHGGEATTKELKRSPKEVRVGHDEGEESSYAQSVLECAVSRERLFLRALRSVAWHSGYGAAVREGRPGAHSAPCESEGRCVACAHTLLPLLTGGMLFHFLFFWRFVHRVCRGQVRSIYSRAHYQQMGGTHSPRTHPHAHYPLHGNGYVCERTAERRTSVCLQC